MCHKDDEKQDCTNIGLYVGDVIACAKLSPQRFRWNENASIASDVCTDSEDVEAMEAYGAYTSQSAEQREFACCALQ
jgi:hypothetical protein